MTTQYQHLWINSFLTPFGLEKFTELIPESFKNFDSLISTWQEAYENGVFSTPSNMFSPGSTAIKEMHDTINGYFRLAGLVPLNEHLAALERADSLQKQNQNKEMNEKEIEDKFLELNNLIQKHNKTVESQKKELKKQKELIENQKKMLEDRDRTIKDLSASSKKATARKE